LTRLGICLGSLELLRHTVACLKETTSLDEWDSGGKQKPFGLKFVRDGVDG